MSSETDETIILEIGAGTEPDPQATHTLDIRTDIPVDFPGVDLAKESIPLGDKTADKIIGYHILEHIPREKVGHVFKEIDRVLKPRGTGYIELPHAGTWSAGTDPTHQGPGGTTPDIDMYLDGSHTSYWPSIDWSVETHARLELPTFVRPFFRLTITSQKHSREWVKFPFVDGTVVIKFRKNAETKYE